MRSVDCRHKHINTDPIDAPPELVVSLSSRFKPRRIIRFEPDAAQYIEYHFCHARRVDEDVDVNIQGSPRFGVVTKRQSAADRVIDLFGHQRVSERPCIFRGLITIGACGAADQL